MLLIMAMMYILQLSPGSPMLAPIYRPLTRMTPPEVPLLLIVPALVIDLLLQRLDRTDAGWLRDWGLAAVGGLIFLGFFVPIHWFFADFMLSPASRNFIFAADTWGYMNRPGDWQYAFWGLDRNAAGEPSMAAFFGGLAIAAPVAVVSARLGLGWGRWMARVRRRGRGRAAASPVSEAVCARSSSVRGCSWSRRPTSGAATSSTRAMPDPTRYPW